MLLAGLALLAACGGGTTDGGDQETPTIDVHPTKEPVAADLSLSWTNSVNILSVEGGNTSGVLWRVVNKTNVEFVKGELMYLTGGVIETFEPTRMEFSTKNMFVDQDAVNKMFIKLTASDSTTTSCVIHLIEGNVASLVCTGFSAPAAQP